MFCHVCNKDTHPAIEGGQDRRFYYRCGNGKDGCNAVLGPVDTQAPAPAAPVEALAIVHSVEAPRRAPTTPAIPGALPTPVSTDDYVLKMKERLAFLETTLEPLNAERDFLRDMLGRVNRTPKRRKGAKVIPLERVNSQ